MGPRPVSPIVVVTKEFSMRPSLLIVLAALAFASPVTQPRQSTRNDDGRAGVVRDAQGSAAVRPVGRERWTPLGAGDLLMPGDQVRTRSRGANAIEIALPGGGTLVLGPGGLVEFAKRDTVRLYRGDVEVGGQANLLGPGGFDRTVEGSSSLVARAADRATSILEEQPRWLTGYRDSTTDEWMGSLVATVDGRDVPLSVGYHKVTVDVRDQIARTTVEQSFVNSTAGTLEGVFFFPLPADASISGFGMWIGDELVEADIVEKQRARQIYEDILRRRKDPGLLEWSGGNLFKARVFPIFPHSEKRIRLRYTQALPMRGGKLRYRYALRSELLRSRPLRALEIDFSVSSTTEIASIESPTHEVRARHTEHSARVEFVAEEFTPERDFEVVVDLARAEPLTVVPHRRDQDGYFMLRFAPPDSEVGDWQRDLLPENGPLDVVLVADTSGSMDAAARRAQAEFCSALLAMLGPSDQFRLLSCDVDTVWIQQARAPVTEARSDAALSALEARRSLGWTDLDRAFAAIETVSDGDTIVVYVGDGIGTVGDADPVALAQRLRRSEAKGTFHAVSTASTYEHGVLAAIASLGGGSIRSTGDDPADAARGLLGEVAQPSIVGIEVRFEGLRTARVYPERLPNVGAGTQQVVLGRFLPVGREQRGRVVVTGTMAGVPVRYSTEVVLRDGENGNSFIPRLWARHHVEALLAEGRSKAVAAEIVRFSEQFGIMTPYTSFLVLENDADRERYGVERRVKMRDGEEFFAEGRDRARTELLQQQMQTARTWRLGLRRRMLGEIESLGEHLQQAAAIGWGEGTIRGGMRSRRLGEFGDIGSTHHDSFADQPELRDDRSENDPATTTGASPLTIEDLSIDYERINQVGAPRSKVMSGNDRRLVPESLALTQNYRSTGWSDGRSKADVSLRNPHRHSVGDFAPGSPVLSSYGFPHLPAPLRTPADVRLPAWPEEIVTLLRKLDRRPVLAELQGGVRIRLTGTTLHPLRGFVTDCAVADGLVGAKGWHMSARGRTQERIENWLWNRQRGALNTGLQLGRTRAANALDWESWPCPMRDQSLTDQVRIHANYNAELQDSSGDFVTVVLTEASHQLRLRIDRSRQVLVESTSWFGGKLGSTTRYGEFIEAGGQWWATRVVDLDGEGHEIQITELEVTELGAEALALAIDARLATHDSAILVDHVDPDLAASKQAVHEGVANFAQQLTVAHAFAMAGQWGRTFESFEEAAKRATGKPGVGWIRAQLQASGRRGDELKTLLRELAGAIVEVEGDGVDLLAQRLLRIAGPVYQADEVLTLLDRLEPAFGRAGADSDWRRTTFQRLRAQSLTAASQAESARQLYGEIAGRRSFELVSITDYIDALTRGQDRRGAIELAARALAQHEWQEHEADQIYRRYSQSLWDRRDAPELLRVLGRWIDRSPGQAEPYRRWLSVLLFAGRYEEADEWIAARLDGPPDGTPPDRAKLGAAIQIALGQGWGYWHGDVEARWIEPLTLLARRFIRSDLAIWYHAQRILSHHHIQRSDAIAALYRALHEDLAQEEAIETMSSDRVGRYVQCIRWDIEQVDANWFEMVASRIRTRWDATTDDQQRGVIAKHLLTILAAHGDRDAAVAFARARLVRAGDRDRSRLAVDLRDRLVQLDWTAAIETELIELLPAQQPEGVAKGQRGLAVRWLSSQLEQMRYEVELGTVADREELPRKELRRRQVAARRTARTALAQRWAVARDAAEPWARPWFELERLCFSARNGASPVETDAEARELYGSAGDGPLGDMLRERCAYLIAYSATRRESSTDLADRVLAFLHDRVSQDGESPIAWRDHLFRLLVVLDRAEPLAQLLREWIVPGKVDSRWRVAYGYLLAEIGELADAAAMFEDVADLEELAPREYHTLAGWYLALDDVARRERALAAKYAHTPEWQLQNQLNQEISNLTRRGDGVPPSLDPEVLRAGRALLHKASHPANYVGQLRDLYRTVKDFRVLESLADGVLGHTPAGVYAFLEQAAGLIAEIHEEATCDRLSRRIATLESQRVVDRRAFLLIELLVERRAAEVLNTPGPHARAGLDAMKRAFDGEWLAGEPRLMASFLASLGAIPQAPFAAEQLRQLRDLARLDGLGSHDRLIIALALARTEWRYGHHDAAIDGIRVALDGFRRARDGVLPAESQSAVASLIGWLESRGRFQRAEAFLRAEIEQPRSSEYRQWLTQRLFETYVNCLQAGGAVDIGHGAELYHAARAEMMDVMFRDGVVQVAAMVATLCQLHLVAEQRATVRTAGADLQQFARQRMPETRPKSVDSYQQIVQSVTNAVYTLSGPRAALTVTIEHLEQEPDWLGRTGQSGWQHHAYQLAQWRSEAGAIGDLEPRLLRITLRELERDLKSMRARTRSIYQHGRGFWSEKADDFAATAHRMVDYHTDSPAGLLYVADYLWNNLRIREAAVDVLVTADRRNRLREDGRFRLVGWLHYLERWSESLPFLDALMETRPDRLDYRTTKIWALHGVGRDGEALQLLDATEQHWRALDRIQESALVELGRIALSCDLHEPAIRLFEELIPLHQRTATNRGVGGHNLSHYYGELARAYSGLQRDDEAVDAASAAVVAWGSRHANRHAALNSLQAVLGNIEDLDAYAQRYVERVRGSGLDAPVIRKALGLVYAQRRQPSQAVRHLLAARDLQPIDDQVHHALVAAFDALGDELAAAEAVRERIAATPRLLDLYPDLGRRLTRLDRPAEAHRAVTTLAEVEPNEAAGHRLLAQLRDRQKKFGAAIVQWRQVTRTRPDEPAGWLALAQAQAHAGDRVGLDKTVEHLLMTNWDSRHGDVRQRAMQLLRPPR